MGIRAFPKIFTIGQDYIKDIFQNPVEVTEKIDGSQFNFGKIEGELIARSKGKEIQLDYPDKMFQEAVDYVLSIEDRIANNTVYHAEYLRKPRHNILAYERTPKNHLILFGMSDTSQSFEKHHAVLESWADRLEIEAVPLLYYGGVDSLVKLQELLETDSVLGNTKVEGVVVKNYDQPFLLGGQPIPVMMGKYVSEAFKETHSKDWKKLHNNKSKWERFCEDHRTEARWQKAVQHLRDKGELENSPRDIGKLMKEIHVDIEEECREEILKFLWREFGSELKRKATAGFPEWYKDQLARRAFDI